MANLVYLLVTAFVGLAIGIPSFFTWSRRWPGMIAGFDPDRCTDVDGLTRRVGAAGMALGGCFLLGAAGAYLVPESRLVVSVGLAVASVVGLGTTMSACARFTRR